MVPWYSSTMLNFLCRYFQRAKWHWRLSGNRFGQYHLTSDSGWVVAALFQISKYIPHLRQQWTLPQLVTQVYSISCKAMPGLSEGYIQNILVLLKTLDRLLSYYVEINICFLVVCKITTSIYTSVQFLLLKTVLYNLQSPKTLVNLLILCSNVVGCDNRTSSQNKVYFRRDQECNW